MNTAMKVLGAGAAAALLFAISATVTTHVLDQGSGDIPPRAADAPTLADSGTPDAAQSQTQNASQDAGTKDDSAEKKLAAANTLSTPEPSPTPTREPLVIKRVLPISGPIKYGEWHWDEEGVPPGRMVITVDLDARVISVFRGGYEIGAAAVLLGTDKHPTPLGSFPILQKKKDNISSIYGAPMPYTLRLTWDGISIHGSDVELGYASHGCVGTPEPFAAKVFGAVKKGDEVIITRGKMVGVGDGI